MSAAEVDFNFLNRLGLMTVSPANDPDVATLRLVFFCYRATKYVEPVSMARRSPAMARLFVSAATWKAFDQVTLTISVTGWDDGLPCRGLALENFTVHQAPGVFDDPFRDGRN
jgi:hypothetical protein